MIAWRKATESSNMRGGGSLCERRTRQPVPKIIYSVSCRPGVVVSIHCLWLIVKPRGYFVEFHLSSKLGARTIYSAVRFKHKRSTGTANRQHSHCRICKFFRSMHSQCWTERRQCWQRRAGINLHIKPATRCVAGTGKMTASAR